MLVAPDWKIYGLDDEDAIIHYDQPYPYGAEHHAGNQFPFAGRRNVGTASPKSKPPTASAFMPRGSRRSAT